MDDSISITKRSALFLKEADPYALVLCADRDVYQDSRNSNEERILRNTYS